jgi:hypothetical protein
MGIITYTPDGYMSAQLMRSGRPNLASDDFVQRDDRGYREEAVSGTQVSTMTSTSGP